MQSVLQVVFLTGQLTFLIKLCTSYAGNLIMPKFLQIIIMLAQCFQVLNMLKTIPA